jgi:purine nucleoside permease
MEWSGKPALGDVRKNQFCGLASRLLFGGLMNRLSKTVIAGFSLWLGGAGWLAAEPIHVKVVVLAMFELGKDTGDAPGEFQYWVEREKLDRTYALPSACHDVRSNADGSIVATVTGMGSIRAAASVTALGLDPRFDFSKAYWLVAGIAGVDPADASLGSAAWAEYVVDGDLAHEIDAREIPADWPTGYVPLRKAKPYEPLSSPEELAGAARNWKESGFHASETGQLFKLNGLLVDWAYELTRSVKLDDNDGMQKRRAAYTGFPNAQRPPFVLKGDNLSAMKYWHGKLLNQWANDWVKYHTDGRGNYVTTAMEDSGTLQALTWLGRAGKVDVNRVLVLRTASNFDMQWPNATAAESLNGEKIGIYSAYLPALEAAHRVGSKVVHAWIDGWKKYENAIPTK